MKSAQTHRAFFAILALCSFFIAGCKKQSIPESFVEIDPIQQKYIQWMKTGQPALSEIREALAEGVETDFRLRAYAVLAAGKIGDPSIAPLLFETLRTDPQPAVKHSAITALADLRYLPAVPYLISLLDTKGQPAGVDPTVIVENLGRMRAEAAVPALVTLLGEDNANLRLKAQNALIEIRSPLSVAPLLALFAASPDGHLDREIAAVLGAVPDPRGIEVLLSLVVKNNSPGQIAAVFALGEMRYTPAAATLLSVMSQKTADPSHILPRKCGEALAKINDPASVLPLIALFDHDDFETRMAAGETLSSMSSPAIAPAALKRLTAGGRGVVPSSYVLGFKHYTLAAPALRNIYRTNGGSEAFYSAQALGRMGDLQSASLLLEGLERRRGESAAGAAWALGALRSREAVDPMIQILRRGREINLKKHCVAALGEIGDRKAVSAILEIPLTEQLEMGDLLGRSLAKLGGEDVFRFMRDHLNSSDENERIIGRFILVHFRGPDRVDFFLELLTNEDSRTRSAAITTLRRNTGKSFGTERQWLEWAGAR